MRKIFDVYTNSGIKMTIANNESEAMNKVKNSIKAEYNKEATLDWYLDMA